MNNQDKDYYIFNNNVIYYADKFDINKHVKFIIDKDEYKKRKNNYNFSDYTFTNYNFPLIQNTVWNTQNNLNPEVYIYFDPVKLSNNPIFSFNEKFHTSKNDYYNRYLLALNKSSDNYNQYKKVFKNIDNYMTNIKQKLYNSYYYKVYFNHSKPKLFYNSLSKNKFYYNTKLRKVHDYKKSKNVYYKFHFDPIIKLKYRDQLRYYHKQEIQFNYQKIYKIDKDNNINQLKYNNIDELAKNLHKNVYMSTILNLYDLYFNPSEYKLNVVHPETNYGIYLVCEQIIIHENLNEKQQIKNKQIITKEQYKNNKTNYIIKKTKTNYNHLQINKMFIFILLFIVFEISFYITYLLI